MTLATGTHLGSYEVTALIGVGGMGEVYRARDTRLDRDVALKVLPDLFARDAERLARFQREAKVLASLNHPNIAGIYGLEETDGIKALVLELVEGPTLADRIAQGPIPLDEALPIAKQIAEALEAAHEQGIIHRDLKPANVKVRRDGAVKVLDFGLAKALEPTGASPNVSQSPTITSPAMTQRGVILGTAAYMSPEQAKGREADKRSDIWAFGCVLYEMLTGRRAFEDEDVSMTLSKVLQREPDFGALPTNVSPTLLTFLKRCLQKDPRQRVRDVGDVRLALEGAFETARPAADSDAATPAGWAVMRRAWPVTLAALILGSVATALVTRELAREPSAQPVRRLLHLLPSTVELTEGSGSLIALSPDGRNLVYRARENNVWQLYRRALDDLNPFPIPGTENASQSSPFFFSDGESVGFTVGTTLMKVSLAGGRPVRIADLPIVPRGASLGAGDTVILGARTSGLLRVSASGGALVPVTKAPDDGRDLWYPQLLPGGRTVLYTASYQTLDTGDIVALDLGTGARRVIVSGGAAGQYVPTGHLVFLRGGDLWAVRFNPERVAVVGDPVPVEQGVRVEPGGAVQFALADDGTLAYIAGGAGATPKTLVWVDRTGGEESIPAPVRGYEYPRISPDGGRVAVSIADQEQDIWTWDFAGQTLARLTTNAANDVVPLWSPDGKRLIFRSNRAGAGNLYWQAADGTGAAERLTNSPNAQIPNAVTSDGAQILFRENGGRTSMDLMRLSVSEATAASNSNAPAVLLQTSFTEQNAALAPGGQWLAYESNDSGRPEIYVRPFPEVNSGRWKVSTDGGRMPLWSRDGKELFWVSAPPDEALVGTHVEAGPMWRSGAPTVIVKGPYLYETPLFGRTFDIAPDGKRFLMIKPVRTGQAPQAAIVVVENWTEELKRLVPVN